MRENVLRKLLDADKGSLGTHVLSTWGTVHEMVGNSGNYDYIEFVGEYAPYDMYSLENMARAIELFPHMSSMIKLNQSPRTFLAARAIGAGFQNVLFADPRTVEDVEECVAAVRSEAPGLSRGQGIAGVGMQRDVGVVLEGGTPAWANALNDGVVAIMIEKKQAVDDLVSLLSVPGVDMVQFGGTDYSASIGLTGQDGRPGTTQHPKVAEAERKVIYTAQRMNIAVRAEPGLHNMQKYLDMGVKHFCSGGDLVSMWQHFTETGKTLNERMGRAPPCSLPFGAYRGGALPGAAAKGYTGGGTSEPSSKPEAKGSKRGSRANGEAPKKRK